MSAISGCPHSLREVIFNLDKCSPHILSRSLVSHVGAINSGQDIYPPASRQSCILKNLQRCTGSLANCVLFIEEQQNCRLLPR